MDIYKTLNKEKENIGIKITSKNIKINDKKEIFDLIKLGNLNRLLFYNIMNTQSRNHSFLN
jgi:hypothetical protein